MVFQPPGSNTQLSWGWTNTFPEVRKLLFEASPGKSSDIPEMNARVLLDCLRHKVDILTNRYMHNKCFETGIYPEHWKHGILVPMPKKQNTKFVNNLRPISLLPIPGKTLERIIHRHVYCYLENSNLLCEQQGGFRPNMDTCHTILDLTNYVHEGFNDNSTNTVAVVVDIAKAFDSIDRNSLLKKFEFFGFTGRLLILLKSYLKNRYQRVNLNGVLSNKMEVKYGVPQGSFIGPLLFILFINDLPSYNFNSESSIYADYNVFYYKNANVTMIYEFLQKNLNICSSWCITNRLTLNANKTKAMFFSEKPRHTGWCDRVNIHINDLSIEFVDCFTYLGVTFDKHGNFMQHYTNVINKFKQKIHLFCSIRSLIDPKTAVILYKSHLLSFLEYGSIFVDGLSLQCRVKLQRLQNSCLRVCYKSDGYTSNFDLHKTSNLLP